MELTGQIIDYDIITVKVKLDKLHDFKLNQPVTLKFKSKDVNYELRKLNHALIDFMAKEQGLNHYEVYRDMLVLFGWYDQEEINNIMYRTLKSTKNGEIDNKNLSEFHDMCERHACEIGLEIDTFIQRHLEIRRNRGKE
ncbi:MAG: hypothetical protein ACYDEI_00230 [Erysipelotrichaceae bacterium]